MRSIVGYYRLQKSNNKEAEKVFNDLLSKLEVNDINFEVFFCDFGAIFEQFVRNSEGYLDHDLVCLEHRNIGEALRKVDNKLGIIGNQNFDYEYYLELKTLLRMAETILVSLGVEFMPWETDEIFPILSKLMCQKYEALKSEQPPPKGNTATTDTDHKPPTPDQQPKQEQQQDLPEINVMSSILLLWYLHKHQGKYVGLKGGSNNIAADSTKEQIEIFKKDFDFEKGTLNTYISKLSFFETMNKDNSDTFKRYALPIEPYIKKFSRAYDEYKKHLAQPTNERPPRKPK